MMSYVSSHAVYKLTQILEIALFNEICFKGSLGGEKSTKYLRVIINIIKKANKILLSLSVLVIRAKRQTVLFAQGRLQSRYLPHNALRLV